ncbi:MAG: S41 family peptidase [Cellulosilyticaceae bacterium]
MLSVPERVYGLSLLWKEAEYNFCFWDKCKDVDWDLEYKKYLHQILEVNDDLEYYALLMKFIALLKDAHTYVVMPESIKPEYQVPIGTTYIEGKHILAELPKSCGIEPYGEILAINGLEIEAYLEQYAYPYIWHELPDGKFRYGLLGYVISCCEQGEIIIETSNGSVVFCKGEYDDNVEMVGGHYLTHSKYREAKTYFDSDTMRIKITNQGIGIIDLFTFGDNTLQQQILDQLTVLQECKGFIIDIRDNNGGRDANSDAVIQAFVDQEIERPYSTTLIHNASFKAYGQYRDIETMDLSNPWNKKIYDACTHGLYESEKEFIPRTNYPIHLLTQPIVILCNSGTACAAECFILAMKSVNRATTIGSRTFGSCGQPYMGSLPGGGNYGICTSRTYLPNGEDLTNNGITPDICVEISVEDHKKSFDSVMDKGLHILEELCK